MRYICRYINYVFYGKFIKKTEEGQTVVFTHFNSSDAIVKGVNINGQTAFCGVSQNDAIFDRLMGQKSEKIYRMLIQAVNNRTVERDYFKLYCDLLEGIITDEEYDEKIENNPEKYVLSSDVIPTKEELCLALDLVKEIHGVENSEDLASLFSYNSIGVDKLFWRIF